MGVGDPFADAQAQTASPDRPGLDLVHLVEAVKDVGDRFFRDADAGVLDQEARGALSRLHEEGDSPARGRIFDGIVYDVEEQLSYPSFVPSHGDLYRLPQDDAEPLRLGEELGLLIDPPHEAAQVDG